MKLPLPKLIFAYRTDTTDRLPADLSRNVSKSIISLAGPRLATITCLQYSPGSDGPYVTSYYAEHPTKVGSVAINAALDAARDPGFCGPNFDLKMLPAYVPDAPRDVDNSLPPGVLGDDEATLEEINQTVGLYRPMLLSAQKGEIQNPKKNDSLSNTSHTSAADQVTAVSADIASCPQLGITHP
ncbi:MAG TPA: hypothetical protein VKU42_13325, partial [Candidatus Angelobacter sp.]|nr:hypothetical protein [Candidatus Angelobacter sp.]